MAAQSSRYPSGSIAPRITIVGGIILFILGLFFLIGGEGLFVREGVFGLGTMPIGVAFLLGLVSAVGLILLFWGIGNSGGRQPRPVVPDHRNKPLTLQPPIGK